MIGEEQGNWISPDSRFGSGNFHLLLDPREDDPGGGGCFL